MKILIIESEIYLAQSIANKLGALGHECEIADNVKQALNAEGGFDAVLLSSSLGGQNFYPLIEKFSHRIIILLASYISNDTIWAPLKAGATDYIQKPFMMEELIAKIEHHAHFRMLKRENGALRALLDEIAASCEIPPEQTARVKFPLLLRGGDAAARAAAVFKIAGRLNAPFKIVSARDQGFCDEDFGGGDIFYVRDFDALSDAQRDKILKKIENKRAIVASDDAQAKGFAHEISLAESGANQKILSIEEYVKFAVSTYQQRYSDSDLAAALGISRKSLWEKRKKYGIARKK